MTVLYPNLGIMRFVINGLYNMSYFRRDQTIRDLINSYDVYEDLMAKSQKGLEFYKKLEVNVGRLLARCRGVCKVQQEEREQITKRYKPKGKKATGKKFIIKLSLFLYPSFKASVLGAQKNRLIETVLLSTHNACFS